MSTTTISVFQNRETGEIINPRSPDFVLSPWEVVDGAETWEDVFASPQEIDYIDGFSVIQIPTITEIVEANINAGFDQRDEPDYGSCLLGSILAHAQNAQDSAHEFGYNREQCREAFYRVIGSLVGQRVDGLQFLKIAQHNADNQSSIDGSIIRLGHPNRPSVYFVLSESGYILSAAATRSIAEAALDPPVRITTKITIPKRANQWGEYHCKAYDQDGKRHPGADYYTDDRQDAEDTRKLILARFQR